MVYEFSSPGAWDWLSLCCKIGFHTKFNLKMLVELILRMSFLSSSWTLGHVDEPILVCYDWCTLGACT